MNLSARISALVERVERLEAVLRLTQPEMACLDTPATRWALIQRVVGLHFGFSTTAILGRCRQSHLAYARMVAVALASETMPLSRHELAELIERDRATISHSVQAVRDRCATEPSRSVEFVKLRSIILEHINQLPQEHHASHD